MKRILVTLSAVLPGLAGAETLSEHVKQLEQKVQVLEAQLASMDALRARLDAMEQRTLVAQAPAAAPAATPAASFPPGEQSDDAPAVLTQGELDKMKTRIANQQLKVDTLHDASTIGPMAGLGITGYVDPSYVMNRAQRSRQFLFMNKEGYTYDNSTLGDVYLDIKKTFGAGTYAPFVDLQIMPHRGDGVYALGTDPNVEYKPSIFTSALVTVPLSDTTAATAGFMTGFAGYEYMQSNLMMTMSHNLLYDFSMTGDFTGAGLNYAKGSWAFKSFIANEEYHTASTALPSGQRNRVPTVTARADYYWSTALDIGASFSWGKNTLGNSGNAYAYNAGALNMESSDGGATASCAAGYFGSQCTSTSPFTTKYHTEIDASYTQQDMQLSAEVDYGRHKEGAWNGGDAVWYGVSMMAHRKMTLASMGRVGATVRLDYLNNRRNGGGGGELFMPSGTDGNNGFGADPQCLKNSVVGGIDCPGANRWALTTAWLFYPTDQMTIKTELRYDRATLPVFIDADGYGTRSNTIMGVQFVYSF